MFSLIIIFISIPLCIQAVVSIMQMITGWDGQSVKEKEETREFEAPNISFSIIVPARHEAGVIGKTLERLSQINYPKELFEVIVPLTEDDTKTIAEVEQISQKVEEVAIIKPLVFHADRPSKPKGLNKAFAASQGEYVVIFDAEDEVSPNILQEINRVVLHEGRKVIQVSVELVNWQSRWFTIHSALEYYFWFRSRLLWFAKKQVITLGGVGVFIPAELITKVNGWDEECLTEDAKLGIDLSTIHAKFKIITSPEFAVKEETPTTIKIFIKQRTRWIQGFYQITSGRSWSKLNLEKQTIFLSLVVFPLYQLFLQIWLVLSIFFSHKLGIGVALLSFIPLLLFVFQMVIQLYGVCEMLVERGQTWQIPKALLLYILGFYPYQIVLSVAGIRAVYRIIKSANSWEKTEHTNAHRIQTEIKLA